MEPMTRTPTPLRRRALLAPALILAFTAACGEGTPERSPLPAQTPLAAGGHAQLTPHLEMVQFLEELAASSDRMELDTLGHSVEGRVIPYLRISRGAFGADRENRTMVLIFAQQHGNEPSGKEGALELALEIARGDHDDLLAGADLLLVPQINPDGGERYERQNADGTDLNRSHFILNGPEVVALRELFHEWEPEVAVDVHQYYPWSAAWLERGWLRLWDLQIGLSTNLNTDAALRALAEDRFLPGAIRTLEEAGFTAHNYVVGSPDALRWSTTNMNDGRQGFGILHTLSFIYEGKREQTEAGNIQRRAEAQRTGMEYLLRFAAEEGQTVRRTVREARSRAAAGDIDRLILTMGRAPGDGPLRAPMLSVSEEDGEWVAGDTVTAVIEGFIPVITEGRSIPLPDAYLIPAEMEGLIELLTTHRVEMESPDPGTDLAVERLEITGFTTEELEGPTPIASVRTTPGRYEARAGDVLIRTAQLRGVMVATALEPESMHGLLRYDEFAHLNAEGSWPIMRVVLDE
jgi:hypothetical protein